VIELTRSEISRNGISLRTRFLEKLPEIHADRTQLQQVILNLLVNAIQALGRVDPHRRELTIETSIESVNGISVYVRDSGVGIDPEGLEQLFEPFYTTKPGGMGMGLSICRSIIEAHSGRIWATANSPQGACFQFTIPMIDR